MTATLLKITPAATSAVKVETDAQRRQRELARNHFDLGGAILAHVQIPLRNADYAHDADLAVLAVVRQELVGTIASSDPVEYEHWPSKAVHQADTLLRMFNITSKH